MLDLRPNRARRADASRLGLKAKGQNRPSVEKATERQCDLCEAVYSNLRKRCAKGTGCQKLLLKKKSNCLSLPDFRRFLARIWSLRSTSVCSAESGSEWSMLTMLTSLMNPFCKNLPPVGIGIPSRSRTFSCGPRGGTSNQSKRSAVRRRTQRPDCAPECSGAVATPPVVGHQKPISSLKAPSRHMSIVLGPTTEGPAFRVDIQERILRQQVERKMHCQ